MAMRKFLGFVVGCGGSLILVASLMMSANLVPRGPGWIFFFIGCGLVGAKLFARPRETVEPVLKPISRRWWLLDRKLRLAVVACCIWAVAVFALQNGYHRNMSWVFIPPIALLVLYFAWSWLIDPKKTPPAGTAVTTPPQVSAFQAFSGNPAHGVNRDSLRADESSGAINLPDGFIVAQYRAHAATQGADCAPTSKTSDARVLEVYHAVLRAFGEVASDRSELLEPSWLNFIAWKFMQVEEMLGQEMLASHLAYETRRYREEGLRPEYRNELNFAAYKVTEHEQKRDAAWQPSAGADRGSGSAAEDRSETDSPASNVDGGVGLSSSSNGVLVLVLVLGALAALGLWSQRSTNQPGEAGKAVMATEGLAKPAMNQARPQSLTVAAIKANLRKDASVKSASIQVMSRGDSFEPLAESNGFLKLALPNGRTGWIAKSLVVSSAASTRLAGLKASQYASSPERRSAVVSFRDTLSPYAGLLGQMMSQVASDSRLSSATTARISSLKTVAPTPDDDAAIWFALEAKWQSDNGAPPNALAAARAAVAANPADVDNLVALGLAAIKADDPTSLGDVISTLPLLAPEATNTWVLVGAWAAAKGDNALSAGALRMALGQSRNQKVTQAFLLAMATKVDNQLVAAAFQDAGRQGGGSQDTAPMQSSGEASPFPAARCADMRYGTPGYHERMANLVRAAGGRMAEPGFHKYHEALVSDLCRGDRNSAVALVQNGFVDSNEAEKIRSVLSPKQAPLNSASPGKPSPMSAPS
jgi:hypothetical protein